MNRKSPLFSAMTDIPSGKFTTKVNGGKDTILYQIQCHNGLYMRSFQYSLYTLLKNTDAKDYNVDVVLYGGTDSSFVDSIQDIGIGVYKTSDTFLNKGSFLRIGYLPKGDVVFVDADAYFFPGHKVIGGVADYTAHEPYFRPKDQEQAIQWKMGKSIEEASVVLGVSPEFLEEHYEWHSGCYSKMSRKMFTDPKLVAYSGVCKSDEVAFLMFAKINGYSTALLPAISHPTKLTDADGDMVHWSPRMDDEVSNADIMQGWVDA